MKIVFAALLASATAYKLHQHEVHACDFINDDGTEKDMSLNPNNKEFFLQTGSQIRFEADGSDMPRA